MESELDSAFETAAESAATSVRAAGGRELGALWKKLERRTF